MMGESNMNEWLPDVDRCYCITYIVLRKKIQQTSNVKQIDIIYTLFVLHLTTTYINTYCIVM
jgi:hypothetical protein